MASGVIVKQPKLGARITIQNNFVAPSDGFIHVVAAADSTSLTLFRVLIGTSKYLSVPCMSGVGCGACAAIDKGEKIVIQNNANISMSNMYFTPLE